jgi:ADP-ribose diphosphatase
VPKPFVVSESRVLLETPIFRLREDRATHPDTGHSGNYYVLENPDWVNMVALTREGQLLLVRQWRHGTGSVELELPAGMVEPGEPPEEAAARELLEETGYAADRVTRLGSVRPNCAYQTNTCTSVLLEGCHLVGPTRFDPGEDIEHLLVDPKAVPELVRSGELRNGMVITALFFWLDARGRIDFRP